MPENRSDNTVHTTKIVPPDLSSRQLAAVVERQMQAPPSLLFRAWTELFDYRFAARGTLLMKGEVDARYFFETIFEGKRYAHYGRFLRLEHARLVEMTWVTSETYGFETVVTVALSPQSGGTRLRLKHAGFPDEKSRKRHAEAWHVVLEHLDQKIITEN
jgi:uncharacterized protein YndB with AHSA1/START domain